MIFGPVAPRVGVTSEEGAPTMRDLHIDEIGHVYGAGGKGSCRPRSCNPCGSRGRGSRSKGRGSRSKGHGSKSKGRSKGRC